MRSDAKTPSHRTGSSAIFRSPLGAEGSGAPSQRPGFFAVALIALAGALVGLGLLAPLAGAATPTHPFIQALSHEGSFTTPCGTATDPAGDLYVASFNGNVATDAISVYGSTGALITQFSPTANTVGPCALAVDSGGDVYVEGYEADVVKYKPSSYPPTAATTYEADTSVNGTGKLATTKPTSVAVDPADQHVYVAEAGVNEKQTATLTTMTSEVSEFALGNLPSSQCSSTTTAPIKYSSAAATRKGRILAALGAACGGEANFAVSTAAAPAITFQGALASTDVPLLTCSVTTAPGSCSVANTTNGVASHVSSFEANGTLLSASIGADLVSAAAYYGVDVYGADGDVYVTDKNHDRAYVLNPAGTAIIATITGAGSPEGAFTGMKFPYLAVDQANGHVFVSDIAGHGVVDEFDAAGEFVSQLGPTFGNSQTFVEAEPSDIAVDDSTANAGTIYVTSGNAAGGSVYAFGPLAYTPPPEAITSPPVTAVTQTTAVLHGEVNPRGTSTESCEFLWGAAEGDYSGGSAPCEPDPGSANERLAVAAEATGLTPHSTVHWTVRITTPGGTVEGADQQFVASAPPAATTEGAEAEEEAATVHGTVNPAGGSGTVCTFEYGASETYGSVATCSPNPGSASSPVAVEADLTRLEARTTYHYRVVIQTDGGTARGDDGTFTTSAVPTIVEEGAADLTKDSATLTASIVPNGLSTTYHFEYLPLAAFEDGGFSNPATISTPESNSIGEGHAPVFVEQPIAGLQEKTAYEFRVVATNSADGVMGMERGFFTCDASYSSGLPDCRAYELVSPAEKGPLTAVDEVVNGVAPSQPWNQVAPDGSAVAYEMSPSLPDATAGGEVLYRATRSPAGWLSGQLSPPALFATERTGVNPPGHYLYSSPSLDCGFLSSSQPLTPRAPRVSEVGEGGENLFRRNPDGSYTIVTYLAPSNNPTQPRYLIIGASADCGRVIFETNNHYEGLSISPSGQGSELYEWDAASSPALRHVGFVPSSSGEVAVIAEAGAYGGENYWNAVSPDASRVIFSARSQNGQDSGKEAVFLRSGGATTTDVSQSETSTVDQGALYQDASVDGSRVFFTANYGLVSPPIVGSTTNSCFLNGSSHANNGECDLYEYDSANPAGSRLSDLSADHNPADSAGAVVEGVLGTSADGSHVYFAAQGQLLPGQGRTYRQNVAAGTYSIYLSDEGALSYVGLARTSDTEVLIARSTKKDSAWVSRVTPDGSHLLFATTADVTGYESGGVREAYLYSAGSDTTVCISCRPDGLPSVGTPEGPGTPTTGPEGGTKPLVSGAAVHGSEFSNVNPLDPPVILSPDGRRVFFQMPDALSPGAVEGAHNIYEWESGTIYLLATGDRTNQFPPVEYVGASADGSDVFLATSQRLAPQDTDGRKDLYDLRAPRAPGEAVGFPGPQPPSAPCDALSEGACQGTSSQPPAALAPATPAFQGPGNQTPREKRHHRKRHHRKRHRHHRKMKHHKTKGRQGRAAGNQGGAR